MRTSSWHMSVIVALLMWCVVAIAKAQSSVTISIDTSTRLHEIPPDFIGLSFEMEKVLPNTNGSYYFSPANKSLLALFRTLGIRNLRVGGNTADRPSVRVPLVRDIDTLFAFANAADVKVIYTLRLRGGSPQQAAEIVSYIVSRYLSLVECFAIGNEPNVFSQEYLAYRDEWKRYVELITSPAYAPGAKFCGPSATPGKAVWSSNFARDVGKSEYVTLLTQHAYPGGSGLRIASPQAGIDSMLSISWLRSYQEFHDVFVPAVMMAGLPYRIEETNNFFHAGAAEVSNTFASALWGLDYLHWWAARSAAGVNFHTGDSVAAGEGTRECYYASFVAASMGYNVRPLGYALKAFQLGGEGTVVPVRFTENQNTVNITAYGVIAKDGSLLVTLINKEHGTVSAWANVTLAVDVPYLGGEQILLTAPDIAARRDVRLGSAEIDEDASWDGKWTAVPTPAKAGVFVVHLPQASAAIVKLRQH